VKRALHGRERKRKKDIRLKVANLIASTAKELNAVVVLEKLPKECPKNMIKSVKNATLRHRIYQAGFRSVVKAIEEECFERGIPVVKVNPKDTSSRCPFCSSKLMRGHASRHLKCSKCEVEVGRDVVAVINIERRYLTYKGLVPLAPMPCELALEVAVLLVKEWARRKSLGATNKNKLMRMSI
jgi:putative transposase